MKCVYKDNSVWGRMMEMVGKVTGMVGGMGEGVWEFVYIYILYLRAISLILLLN